MNPLVILADEDFGDLALRMQKEAQGGAAGHGGSNVALWLIAVGVLAVAVILGIYFYKRSRSPAATK
jgi:LPXTG-motif cell wall-anchored protein